MDLTLVSGWKTFLWWEFLARCTLDHFSKPHFVVRFTKDGLIDPRDLWRRVFPWLTTWKLLFFGTEFDFEDEFVTVDCSLSVVKHFERLIYDEMSLFTTFFDF